MKKKDFMKICFYGVGGVGGYFGSLITEKLSNSNDIYFIARGNHKEVINSKGLTLKKSGGEEIILAKPKLCTNNINEIPVCDIIIVSVKSYDLTSASEDLNKISNDNTIILPLLNGVDVNERIREKINKAIVLRSCVYVGTHIESPGVIYQKGGNCRISIGPDPKNPEYFPEKLLNLLKKGNVNFEWSENIQEAIWSKYMFIASFGLVTSTYNKTLGEIIEDKKLLEKTRSIMNEIFQISKKLKVNLKSSIINESLTKATEFPFETKTSFQRDIEKKGLLNEKDLFGGTLIKYSEIFKVKTPSINEVYSELNIILERKYNPTTHTNNC
jgi:2-dehydropantoate 2-reductase